MNYGSTRQRHGDTNDHVVYAAVLPGNAFEDEITPLLDEMDDSKIGISQQTLVSNAGSGNIKRGTQFLAAIAVTLGAFALGNVLGWTSPADDFLKGNEEKNITGKGFSEEEASWIGATMALGAAVSVIPVGAAMDLFGRKKTMLALAPPFVAGWLLIAFADEELWMYIPGRFITGMMGGAFSLTAPTYTSEIADDGVRGMLGSFFQLMVTVGILFVYILGGAEVSVPIITYVCTAIPVAFFLIFMFMPETPSFELKRGDEAGARKALQWFRGSNYSIDEEIREQKESLERAQEQKLSLREAFSSQAAKRGLFIAMGLMVFQQLSGINAVIFFSASIFKDAGSDLDPNIATIIVGAGQVIATFASSQIVDRLGRKILLLLSDSVMSVCCILLAVFFFIKKSDADNGTTNASSIGWLPLMSLCIFIVVFSLGYGPIPWMMMGELFAPNIKAIASSLACTCNWVLAFLVTKFFSNLNASIGQGPTFLIFAAVSAVGTVFVFFFVPETKGKSFSEIQAVLGGEPKNEIPEIPEKY